MNQDVFIASRADADGASRKIRRAGASLVVSPYVTAGEDLATAVLHPHVSEFLGKSQDSVGHSFMIGEVLVEDESDLQGTSVLDAGRLHQTVAFLAIKPCGREIQIRPNPHEVFSPGDVLIVAGKKNEVAMMQKASRARQEAAAC